MMLTDSPLDDYQRLCFKNNSPYNVHTSTYKSNLTPTMRALLSHFDNNPAAVKQDKLLNCNEYQFPDLVMSYNTESHDDNQENGDEARSSHVSASGRMTPMSSPSRCGGTNSESEMLLDAKIEVPFSNSSTGAPQKGASFSGVASGTTISKNQQFKLTNLNSNHRTINNNNCILWTDFHQTDNSEDNFVFLTGIWRLYQDVMKGLIKTPRKSGDSQTRQDFCRQEYDFIISNCFCDDDSNYENNNDINDYSKKFHRRKSTGTTFTNITPNSSNRSTTSYGLSTSATTGASNNSASKNNSNQPNYVDFHWFDIPEKFRYQLFNQFEKHLREERQVDTTNLPKFEDYIQRIRGGYIKIQGTWVPWYIAKSICVRFCFPIRYLLVPIFGDTFPKECEDYFFNTHMNNLNDFLKSEHMLTTNRRRRKSTGLISPPSLNSSVTLNNNESHLPPFLSPNCHRSHTHVQTVDANGRRSSETTISPGTRTTKLQFKHNPAIIEEPAYSDLSHDAGHYGMHTYSDNHLVPENMDQHRKRSLSWSYSSQLNAKKQKLPPISLLMKTINWNNNQSVNLPSETNPTVQTISKLASFYTTRGHKYSYPENIFTVNNSEGKAPYNLKDDKTIHNQAAYASPTSTSSSASPKNYNLGVVMPTATNNGLHFGYDATAVPRNVPDNLYESGSKRLKVSLPHNFSDTYSFQYRNSSTLHNPPKTKGTYYSPIIHNE
ncbi:Xbp1p [Nakaseomyces bracarensis]|uniref:Xbp1p n=1 Tax=Nakaseomyces bracarensis TaxID=273131 RepID=UPI00387130C4